MENNKMAQRVEKEGGMGKIKGSGARKEVMKKVVKGTNLNKGKGRNKKEWKGMERGRVGEI